MKTEDFNRMLRSARDMLARYHEGVTFDPATVHWAQELTAANPVDKRRPTPKTDKLMDLFVDPVARKNGLTFVEMAAMLGEKEDVNSARVKLVSKLCMQRKMFSARDGRCARYFVTGAERDAWRGTPKAKPEQAPKIPRLAKTARPRQHVKRPIEAQQIPQALFNPKTPKVAPPASGSVFIPSAPSPTIDPNDPRIQRAQTPKGRFEVTEADLHHRTFSASKPGTNPLTGRPW